MQLCLALDLESRQKNLKLLEELKDFPHLWVKVGLRSFIRDGVAFLESIKKISEKFRIFLDLKLYDIPNTMADAAEECAKLGVDMITIHASSGTIAMQNLMQRLNLLDKRPLVLGVTALTSFDARSFREVYARDLETCAIALGKMAHESKLDGVVCSVFESKLIKQNTSDSFLTLTPGIRPFCEESNDQQRVGSIKDAHQQGSNFIVIGRPIYKAQNPQEVVNNIYKEIEECKS
ncbi:orotidine 5'-phosphate decarboxylase [Helicobacter mustelae]|uniref:orotidine-5'-phosphate decarboxylase n=1 Tax=Helicobacter mustelae TaxID=217 RepID=UPI000E02B888|nr:orotidine-5'-phosphate decarboxylase [Helicobacter mustelae]STP12060.1 orotidine 5'-phosphate decarboxylase [Helicobacter mustelae]